MNTKTNLVALFLLLSIEIFGQVAVPFSMRRQMYVKGDMTMIANNIVNRKETFNGPNIPYDKIDATAKLNDEFDMQYIDIDSDKSTYSSSSADLVLENDKSKKIVYAGLYWSATYTTKSSKSPRKNEYLAVDKSRESFDRIKIKLPNQTAYSDIQGKLIFDGANFPNFKESSPYAMYADITSLVKNLKNPQGKYVVANVKSTVGKVSGGVSGGWSIFFIYEDSNMTGKFITTYDGFAGVSKTAVDVNFSGFQTLPHGDINAKIACAGLEGDLNLAGDQIFFKSEGTEDFYRLSDYSRPNVNVFNSSISLENEKNIPRQPSSKNTLGYDSYIMTILNPKNEVIKNNTKGATVKFKSYGDRYFVFFNAFNVEVIPPKSEEIEKTDDVFAFADPEPKNTDVNKDSSSSFFDEETKPIVVQERKVAPKNEIIKSQEDIFENKDYYLVAGVFAVPSNATRLVENLKKKGIDAYYITNPKNNYRYVYVRKVNSYGEATELYTNNLGGKYKKDLWIFDISEQRDSSLAENDNVAPYKGKNTNDAIKRNPINNDRVAVTKTPKNKESLRPKAYSDVVDTKPDNNLTNNKDTYSNKLASNSETKVIEKNAGDQSGKKNYAFYKRKETKIKPNDNEFYVIVGVFSIYNNANRLITKLKNSGTQASSFISPVNNYKYVYISKHNSYEEALTYCDNNKLKSKFKDEIWILDANRNANRTVAEIKSINKNQIKNKQAVVINSKRG